MGKTTISALLARGLAERGRTVLAVDCDPNPTLAEEFGLLSAELPRFSHAGGLRRAGDTLELWGEPDLVEVGERLRLLGGPPGDAALADAVARGIAGVLLSDRFDAVVTDLGAGPELTEAAVGGVLNPSDLCLILHSGLPVSRITAERIASACARRDIPRRTMQNPHGAPEVLAEQLVREFQRGRR